MRIRSTKPEFWRSRRIAEVDWDARLVLKALESYVDDNGVGKDDLALIVADTFPRDLSRDPRETLARVADAISALADAGLVWRYEHEGTDLLYISWWESVQRVDRPNKPRFPRPDGTFAYGESDITIFPARPSRDPRDRNRGTGEQGNRGTGERTLLPETSKPDDTSDEATAPADAVAEAEPADDQFEEFWETYDHKVGRKKAMTAYRRALKRRGVTAQLLIAAAAEYVTWQRNEGKHPTYTKHPATWLNGEHWNDERAARPARAAPDRRIDGHLELVQQLAQAEAQAHDDRRQIGSNR